MNRNAIIAALLIAGSAFAPTLISSAHAGNSRDRGLLRDSIYALHRANAGFAEAEPQTASGGRVSEAQNHIYDGNNGLFPVQTSNRSFDRLFFNAR